MRSIWHTALAKALNSSPFCETTQFFFLPISVLYQHTCQLYASEAHAEEMKMPHCLERFSQKEVSQALRLHHETCFRPFGFPEPSFFSIFELFFFLCLPLFSVLCCSFFFSLYAQSCHGFASFRSGNIGCLYCFVFWGNKFFLFILEDPSVRLRMRVACVD